MAMKKIMMLPWVEKSCAKWSGATRPGALIATACCVTHQDRLDQRAAQHDHGEDHVHDADLLVVEARQPHGPEISPSAEDRDQSKQKRCTQHRDAAGETADDFADRRIPPGLDEHEGVPGQPSEQDMPEGHRSPMRVGVLVLAQIAGPDGLMNNFGEEAGLNATEGHGLRQHGFARQVR